MKKNKYFFLTTILFSCFFFIGCRKPHNIRFDNEIYDFGEVKGEEDVHHTYIFKNTGTETLIIESVRPACGCTTTSDWDKTVEPGKKGEIPINFKTPKSHGEVEKIITVKTNIPERESIILTIKGMVVIPVEIIPDNAWIGEINKDTEYLPGSFKIKSNLPKPFKITSVTPPDIQMSYTLTSLEENKKYSLDFVLYPPFQGREKVGKKFTLQTNNDSIPYLYPQFYYYVPPPIQITPPVLFFHQNQLENESNTRVIIIKSNIEKPIRILDMNLYGSKKMKCVLGERIKDIEYQITVTVSRGFSFSDDREIYVGFRILNDPEKKIYNIPIRAAK